MNVDLARSRDGTATSPAAVCCAPLRAPQLSPAEATATAALFKALGNPQRVRIVNLLAAAAAPVCVCDLTAALGIAQPTVSHHLRKLVDGGLLTREQRGTWAYYALDPEAMRRLADVATLTGGSP
ncbi:MAG: metalloregulator ArsR/SmtB family transcription factor [Actinomycetota bacterium]|jgi:ArsR family transcriptional regulator|nr:metalloregulator ArsR/SmtB family transcription factor [Actinomycetota bacterium]